MAMTDEQVLEFENRIASIAEHIYEESQDPDNNDAAKYACVGALAVILDITLAFKEIS